MGGMAQGSSPVLIVEDNAATRDVVQLILQMKGYETVTAEDGLDALAVLRTGVTPSVVVLDVRMPNMDGVALQRAMRADARWASIPVVIFSAFPPKDPEGAVAVVPKGKAGPDMLLAAVATAHSGLTV
jgi:CheY-like chemotaxis protein